MKFREELKAFLLYFADAINIHLGRYDPSSQRPFLLSEALSSSDKSVHRGPVFKAPNGPDSDEPFLCEYPSMGEGWKRCSTKQNRGCWLESSTGETFDIHTDYDTRWPKGITREYYLEVGEQTINGDGVDNPDGKVFNGTYPGPWIKACWGDLIKVTVRNNLRFNGTTVHWHGIRQLNSTEMDGVNGVTQCPIAPEKEFTYTFRATQYGTSWYHSHYSLQYADGLHGPLTIFGPSSWDYDEAKDPILISDWNHRSAFKDWQRELVPKPDFPKMNSVLLNGHGNFAGAFPRKKFEMSVEKGKKYLLRIINTSVDTTFIFSVDNHNFTVMSSDFVPIHPYNVSQIVVGIGQRYHIVLNAIPNDDSTATSLNNYWIRTIPANGCKGFEIGNEPDERQGVLRYNSSSIDVPQTTRANFPIDCRDEDYNNLVPVLEWKVPKKELLESHNAYDISKENQLGRPDKLNNFSWWAFGDQPLWLNFSDPTILNLDNNTWNPDYVVISEPKGNDGWFYMVITAPANDTVGKKAKRSFFPVAHPMHLHGHDFVLLAQGDNSSKLHEAKLKFDNPPRRDVALIPSGGYLVIAFKTDNPGCWLFHCHIPWHASSGLALQIMERQEDLRRTMTASRLAETRRVCDEWDTWFGNDKNHWAPGGVFQDDSGI